jgi:hypothetical protein
MWGGPIPLAYAVQSAVALTVALIIIQIWSSDGPHAVKAAALIIGTFLAVPYSLDYDLLALAPAIAFLACEGLHRGFAPFEKTALAFLWFVPFISRGVAQATTVSLGVVALLVAFVLLLRRRPVSVSCAAR